MAIIEGAVSGNKLEVDTLLQGKVVTGFPAIGAAGGHYTVTGWTTAVVAASLSANTSLVAMRFNPASGRKAYVDSLHMSITPATLGIAAAVAGSLALQRFTAATPTGGTARTSQRCQESAGTATDMFDIRDSNAALTMTSVVFGSIVSARLVPLFVQSYVVDWYLKLLRPVVLNPGDGLAMRTQVAMPSTQTWMYTYTFQWQEY